MISPKYEVIQINSFNGGKFFEALTEGGEWIKWGQVE